MERNMDLVRELLFYIEKHSKNDEILDIPSIEIPGFSSDQIKHHLLILQSGRLIIAKRRYSGHLAICDSPTTLSWRGYEYLDKIRDLNRWEKLKAMLEKTGDFSYETVTQAVSMIVADQLKILFPLILWTGLSYVAGLATWLLARLVGV